MATIDIHGGDAQRIRGQYQSSLGRDAADHEVEGWLSGSYGSGGVDDWLKQIDSSHEAQQRRTSRTPSAPPQVPVVPGVQTQTGSGAPSGDGPDQAFWDTIDQSYQLNLGRSASGDEIAKWWRGEYGWGDRNNLAGIQRGISMSDEASRRRAAMPQSTIQSYTGFQTGGNDYSAFNTARLQDPNKSAKDAFVYLSNQAPAPPFHSKAAMQQWFNTYIAPGLNALGHKVSSVTEDGFTYSNHEGTFFVDFGQNLGAAPGSMLQRLQWLSTPADDATRQRYPALGASAPPQMPGSMPMVGGAASPSLARPVSPASAGLQQGTPSLGSSGDPNLDVVAMPGWHDFIAQVKPAYQQYLGRAATFEDLKNWFTGVYGHGSGVEGLPAILSAIQNSPEAQARRPPPATPPTTPPTGAVGGNGAPPNQYNDPNTAYLESLIKSRIASLQGGYDDYARKLYEQALNDRARSLGMSNKQLDQLLAYLQERFTDLKGPGYTGAEHEVLRTQALDPMERDRTAARERLTQQLAARGFTPDSGVFQQAMLELDNEFDGIRAITQTHLATNELGRRENRAQRAEAIGAQIADIPELRAREQLDVYQALNNLSLLARQEDEARAREAISYGGVLSDLGPQRLQLAMQAAGMGGNPSQLGSLLSNIMGINQQQGMINQNNNNAMWSGLGTIAAIIARSNSSGVSRAGI